jgi:c-di-GMP-binding flagellar brake protein YcgR
MNGACSPAKNRINPKADSDRITEPVSEQADPEIKQTEIDRTPVPVTNNKQSKRTGNNYNDAKSQKISDPLRIAILLQRLKRAHVILSITIPDNPEKFSSSLLLVDPKSKLIHLDELMPRHGQQYLMADAKVHISASLKGVDVGFHAQLSELKDSSNGPYMILPFPSHISHLQQRSSFRATVAINQASPVTFELDNGRVITGDLRDLSLGGMKIIFKGAIPELIDADTTITNCTMQLPSKEMIECHIDARFMSDLKNRSGTILGAKFVSLNKRLQNKIGRFVASLSRQMARKERHNI